MHVWGYDREFCSSSSPAFRSKSPSKKKIMWSTKRRAYRDGIKRKGDKTGMEYETWIIWRLVSMLTLPETIAQTLLLPRWNKTPGNNVRLSQGVSACWQVFILFMLHIPSLSLHALLFIIHRIFYLLVSTHFFTWLFRKRLNIHTYKISSPCVLLLVRLRNEEVNRLGLFFVGGCHGNDRIHVRTKCHLHVCYTERVKK